MTVLYNRYADELLHYFLNYCHNMMQAEDMLHDLMLRVMSLDMLNEQTAVHLMYCAAHNMVIDDVRHQTIVHRAEREMERTMEVIENSGIVQQIDRNMVLAKETQVVKKLTPMRALVYHMWRNERKGTQEIAAILGLSSRTVEGHLFQSRKYVVSQLRKVV